ncbi:MAG: transposase [Armatimonadota bacterium]|nr:transposase [bacterium]
MERRLHSNEFKENAVRLAQKGDVSVSQVANELGINPSLLHKWLRQFGAKSDGSKSVTPDEHSELIRLRRELKCTQEECEILKKSPEYLLEGTAVRYSFIKTNMRQFHVSVMCSVLKVSSSGFYNWLKDPRRSPQT